MADNNYEIDVTLEETFGTGVRSVEQTATSAESGGMNEITVTLTNDQENKFYVMNGLAGKDGRDGGFPVAVGEASLMTDTSKIYLYVGIEEGYTQNHLYYWDGEAWHDYGTYGAPADYLRSASVTHEQGLDQLGNTTYTADTLTLEGNADGVPAETEFVQKLYYSAGENVDGALTQKATSEAIESAQYLPIVNHPNAPVGDTALSVELQQNVMNVIGGVGYAFTTITMTLATKKAGRVNRYFGRFTTGGNAFAVTWPTGVTVPSALSYKTQTTYDFVIEDSILHVWEDGNAVGDVLDATATANAVSTWLTNHPEATTTVADGSITTAKLASGVIDQTLTVQGAAADAKKTGDEISDLKSQISQGGSFNNEVKSALDLFTASVKRLAQVVAYTVENGQAYYGYIADASDALHSAMYPPANLVSITAVYTQSGTVYDTDSLDNLKSDLIVMANWSNNTSTTITDYMLNGTLTEGTSAITVSYGGKTTTFSVTVTHYKGFAYGKVDKTNAITGSYITESGEIESATSASGYYDDYIDLGGLSSVLIHYIGSDSNFRISVFNTSKEFTRQIHVTGNRYYTFSLSPTTGERYIKLGWYSTSEPTFYIQNVAPTSLIMEIGSIDTNGENAEAANRIRSVGYIPANGVITVDDAPWEMWRGYEYFFRCYDESHNYVGTLVNTGGKLFSADISQVSLPTGTANVRIVMQIKSGSFSRGFAQDTHPFAIDNESYQISEA